MTADELRKKIEEARIYAKKIYPNENTVVNKFGHVIDLAISLVLSQAEQIEGMKAERSCRTCCDIRRCDPVMRVYSNSCWQPKSK